MKKIIWVLLAGIYIASPVYADWQDFLKEQVKKLSEGDQPVSSGSVVSALSNDDVVAGLKEALVKGADYATEHLGKPDGFLANDSVRIPMPENLQKVEKTLRKFGQDKYADEFVETMNRAAEQAVPLTLGILKKGISSMSIEDAKDILQGSDDAATQYLRKVGGQDMTAKIAPIVSSATADVGVTRQYKKLFDNLGFMSQFVDPDDYDIDKYVTDKTVDGLFHMIAVEEKKIRENPLERTTDLLKKVFGS